MFAGIEFLTIQIGNFDRKPLLSQGSPGHLRQYRIERNRLWVAMDDQRMHAGIPPIIDHVSVTIYDIHNRNEIRQK